jgi:DNA-binding transcriptional ArsR family regulator
LGVLRNEGLVKARRDEEDARWIYYSINKGALGELRDVFRDYFDVTRISDVSVRCDRDGNQRILPQHE